MNKKGIIIIFSALLVGVIGFTTISMFSSKEPIVVADAEKKKLSDMSHEELKIFFEERGVEITKEFVNLSLTVKLYEKEPNFVVNMSASKVSDVMDQIQAIVNEYYGMDSYVDEYGNTIWYK